jgi:Phytanoyl-CoA dioxygenase (PhyH)
MSLERRIMQKELSAQGFVAVPQVLPEDECEELAALAGTPTPDSPGTRCLLSLPWCQALAARLKAHPGIAGLIPADFVAAQCTYFEKSAERNWLVPVHQDLSIPVAERVSGEGLSGWSEKEGALFVQPPIDVLERLVAVRLHLDACSPQDGPLVVVPGTHKLGRIKPAAAVEARRSGPVAICTMARGDVLAMRPLLLHASAKASGKSRRRVLHFLFGPRYLPLGLRWQHAV